MMRVRVLRVPDTSQSGARPPTPQSSAGDNNAAAHSLAPIPPPSPGVPLSEAPSARPAAQHVSICVRPPVVSITTHSHGHRTRGPPRTEADGPPGAAPGQLPRPLTCAVASDLRRAPVSPVGALEPSQPPWPPRPLSSCLGLPGRTAPASPHVLPWPLVSGQGHFHGAGWRGAHGNAQERGGAVEPRYEYHPANRA